MHQGGALAKKQSWRENKPTKGEGKKGEGTQRFHEGVRKGKARIGIGPRMDIQGGGGNQGGEKKESRSKKRFSPGAYLTKRGDGAER